jgi:hypothetical protein
MKKKERAAIETLIGQMFWDGRIYTGQFNLYSPEGREKAKKWLADEIEQALYPRKPKPRRRRHADDDLTDERLQSKYAISRINVFS